MLQQLCTFFGLAVSIPNLNCRRSGSTAVVQQQPNMMHDIFNNLHSSRGCTMYHAPIGFKCQSCQKTSISPLSRKGVGAKKGCVGTIYLVEGFPKT